MSGTAWASPFWDDTSKAWVDAAQLEPGHHLLTEDGAAAVVAAVRTYIGSHQMRDLTVNDIHTYYVIAGTSPILVHNCGAEGPQDHVALGRRDYDLQAFSKQVEARNLLGATSDSWRSQVVAAISRASRGEGQISFMLDGLPGANGGPAKALEIARSTNPRDLLHTQWELLQVDDAGMMDRVDFYRYNRRLGGWGLLK